MMIRHIQRFRIILFLFLLLMVPVLTVQSFAEEAGENNPLRFFSNTGGSYLQMTAKAEAAYFASNDAWFGESGVYLGEETKGYWENTFRPGIEGRFLFDHAGELYGRTDAVFAGTDGVDAAGTNPGFGDVSDARMENAYVGWRSGDVFRSLGEHLLDISFGRQQYIAGNGFLFYSESGNGKDRGAYWIGARKTADYAGIARMNYKELTTALIYLKADDNPDTNTKAGGMTLDYSLDTAFGKLGGIGGGYYRIDSKVDARDAMNVYDARFRVYPFLPFDFLTPLKPFKLEGEYVYEDPKDDYTQANGWYISGEYTLAQVPWTPAVTYRYAGFDENYDPLFYGFYDWGYWFQGEILGEYVLSNANLDSHMIKLNLLPMEPVSINFFYYIFKLHDPDTFGVTSDDYAEEWDITIDWIVSDHVSLSLVGAIVDPGDGATEQTGGKDNWMYMMVYGNVSF